MTKKEKLNFIRQYYPHAITTVDALNRAIDFIENNLNIDIGKTMLTTSLCGDDVDVIQYPSKVNDFMGQFHLGGTAGYPFAGLTGMHILANDTPANDAVLLFYAPHIGITKDGQVGYINKAKQTTAYKCCGYLQYAVNTLQSSSDASSPEPITADNYEIATIQQIVGASKAQIIAAKQPLIEATEAVYNAIDTQMAKLLQQTTFTCKYVINMGAIIVNSDADMGSYLQTKRFDVIEVGTGKSTNGLESFNTVEPTWLNIVF